MADEATRCFADTVQYPLATPPNAVRNEDCIVAGGAINAPRKINRGFVPIWELAHLKNGPLSGSFLNCQFEWSRMVSSRTILRSRETCCPFQRGTGSHFSKKREGEAVR